MTLNVNAVSGGIVDDYPEKVTYSRHPLSQMKETYFIDGRFYALIVSPPDVFTRA
jgi:hypothetical protein